MDKDMLKAIKIIRDIFDKYLTILCYAEDPVFKIKELDKIINNNKEE